MQAIEYGTKLKKEDLHLSELGISSLIACFVNANRDPKKSKPANPSDFYYFQSKEDDGVVISDRCANAFLGLIKDKKMPGWVVPLSPIEKIEQSKSNLNYQLQNRALIGEGIAIFCYQVHLDTIYAELSVFDNCDRITIVTDIDSQQSYKIVIPDLPFETFWQLNTEVKIGD